MRSNIHNYVLTQGVHAMAFGQCQGVGRWGLALISSNDKRTYKKYIFALNEKLDLGNTL